MADIFTRDGGAYPDKFAVTQERSKKIRTPAQRAHSEMSKDIRLMNELERFADRSEEAARRARAAARALEVRA